MQARQQQQRLYLQWLHIAFPCDVYFPSSPKPCSFDVFSRLYGQQFAQRTGSVCQKAFSVSQSGFIRSNDPDQLYVHIYFCIRSFFSKETPRFKSPPRCQRKKNDERYASNSKWEMAPFYFRLINFLHPSNNYNERVQSEVYFRTKCLFNKYESFSLVRLLHLFAF